MGNKCYIFDIDGTLADPAHRLHHIQKEPKDWNAFFAAVGADKPILHMIRLVQDLVLSSIVYVSGRSDECKDKTLEWFEFNDVPFGDLYMRKAGDHRPDHIVKIELLQQIRADGWEPIMVFDDRATVVKAWRSAGIPCAQVADGDF